MFHVAHIIAVSNQKGGVGKTTTAVSLAAELALHGRSVLLVDIDPQCNATSGVMGGRDDSREEGDLYDLFKGKISIGGLIIKSAVPRLDIVPGSIDLVGIEIELGSTKGRELILKSSLESISGKYDIIIIDCPPSSGLLTLGALGAATYILVPMQAEYYALEGLSALLRTIDFVRTTFNPRLELLGILLTMFDPRTNLATQVEADVRGHFKEKVFRNIIPRSIKLSEAPSHGLPVCMYDPSSSGAKAYKKFTEELTERIYPELAIVGNL